MYGCRVLVTVAALSIAAGGGASAHKVTLDAGLYGSYSAASDGSLIYLGVCGHVNGGSGCHGGGYLKPFEHACALVEGAPRQRGNIVTREIYVLDKRASTTDPVMLDIFTRTDEIGSGDYVTVALKKQISLGVTGGASAHCALAANDAYVYAGTDASSPVTINKKSFAVAGAWIGLTHAITADARGFVTVVTSQGLVVYDPTGVSVLDGGGSQYFADTRNGWGLPGQ